MTSSSDLDERTLREIYLTSFEGAVKKQKPWTVMNSYNRINGTYVRESKELLTDILRDEWGFDGYVMTDWGAVAKQEWDKNVVFTYSNPDSIHLGDLRIKKAVAHVLTICEPYMKGI